jgi:hypothetical protein
MSRCHERQASPSDLMVRSTCRSARHVSIAHRLARELHLLSFRQRMVARGLNIAEQPLQTEGTIKNPHRRQKNLAYYRRDLDGDSAERYAAHR